MDGHQVASTPSRRSRVLSVALDWVAPALVLAASLALNLVNTSRYPYSRAHFDWGGHVEYIQRIARTWRTPIAVEGWEMFQPPLYYYAAAVVYRLFGGDAATEAALKAVQYFGCLVGVGLVAVGWAFARRLCRRGGVESLVAVSFAAFLPMSLYMNPLVTNEVFSATVIAVAAYGILRFLYAESGSESLWRPALSGTVVGLALLSKYTGLFVCGAGVAALGLRALASRRLRIWVGLGLYAAFAFAVCGWFYVRNARIFGDPFIGNWDEASGFHYEQNPSYRTWEFFGRFGSVFLHHVERARWTSFLNGNYASMWADPHNNFFAMEDTRAYFWLGVLVIVAFLPTAAIVVGFVRTLVSIFRKPVDNPDLLLAAMTVWTFGSLISFTLEIPTYSTVKAFFFLSLVPAFGVFLVRGRAFFDRHVRIGRWVLDASLVVVAALAIALFRFRPPV